MGVESKRVLITGGAGFIGSHIAERCLARGDSVWVIDNYETGRRDNLQPHPQLTVVEGSICDRAVMAKLMAESRPNVVVHAAASYKDPENWQQDAMTNAAGTAIVCQTAKEVGTTRIVYFQTALCYGLKPLEQPITLSHPVLPDGSSYAISKTAGEQYVTLSGLDWVTFRLANAYGPRNISGPLPTFYQRLSTGKSCFVMDTRRDFVYVDDMVDCIMKAIDGQGTGTYHLSSGGDFSIQALFNETLAALEMTMEVEVRPRLPDDVYSILLDPSRTKEDFAWSTSTPLTQGVASTIAYYQKFGIEETYTHLRQTSEEAVS
jgi:UDP-glucose 4-epimerase